MSNKTNQSVLVNDTSSYYLKQYAALQFFVRNERVKPRMLIVFLNRFFVVKAQIVLDQICHRVISRALEQELRTIEVIVRIANFT